jgi:BTB/POZ domain
LKSAKKTNFFVTFELSVIKSSGDVKKSKVNERSGDTFTNWGFTKFISHEDFFSNIQLPTNKLTIMCEVNSITHRYFQLLKNIHFQLSLYAAPNSQPQTSEVIKSSLFGYKNIFENEVLSDFQLKMNDGVTLKAHKSILVARSPVFFKMLTTDMKEAKQGFVEVPDFNSKTMRELLRFMYCSEVENLDEIANDLIFAAEKYEVQQLKELCIDHIISKLTRENVLDALIIADRVNNTDNILNKCMEIVSK